MVAVKPMQGASFWQEVAPVVASAGVAHYYHGNRFQYVVMDITTQMRIIHLADTGDFEPAVSAAAGQSGHLVATNGPFFDPFRVGDSVNGYVYSGGTRIAGRPSPSGFYLRYHQGQYSCGFGECPGGDAGFGALTPIIINNLPYGTVNRYKSGVPENPRLVGEPDPEHRPFLIQRSNSQYMYSQSFGAYVGKGIVALHRAEKKILICVQPQGADGVTYDTLRDMLIALGINDAVGLDGSDSVILMVKGAFHVRQGFLKNRYCSVGMNFLNPPTPAP